MEKIEMAKNKNLGTAKVEKTMSFIHNYQI